MRSTERDALLFLLAISAGSADAWSYLGLGHAFVANMTGNTVLAGIAVFQKGGDLSHPLISLSCYAAGAAGASFFTRKVRDGVTWSGAVTLTLLLEAAIMAAAAAEWLAVHLHAPANAVNHPGLTLLGCVAFAIGMQSGAMLRLKIPGIVTTYITGTWTTLMSGVVRFVAREKRKPPQQKIQFEERLFMQAGILVVYFLSAVLTGWLFGHAPAAVGTLSAASVMAVAIYAAARGARATEES